MGSPEVRQPIPSYGRPPVIEAVIGAEFLPIDELDIVQLVRLHDRWASRFPRIELQPELPSASRFANQLPVVFNTGVPPVRLWSLAEGDEILVQVQTDRLMVNWRRVDETTSIYPRYGRLVEIFEECWAELNDHLREMGIDSLTLMEAEVTYVNSISYDPSSGPSEVLTILADESGLPAAREYNVRRSWQLESEDRRFEQAVTVNAIMDAPGHLRMDVVTRVPIPPALVESPRQALDLAHDTGVRAFTACTSASKHIDWERSV